MPRKSYNVETVENRERPDQTKFWIEGEGLEREVLQSNIQHFLGRDAHMRTEIMDGINGYLITAARQFTTKQLDDLVAMSKDYRQSRRRGVSKDDAVRDARRIGSPGTSQRPPSDPHYQHRPNDGPSERMPSRSIRQPYLPPDPYPSDYPPDYSSVYDRPMPDNRRIPNPTLPSTYPPLSSSIPSSSSFGLGPTSYDPSNGIRYPLPPMPSDGNVNYGPDSNQSWGPPNLPSFRNPRDPLPLQSLRSNRYGFYDCPARSCDAYDRHGLRDMAEYQEHMRRYHPYWQESR